MGLAADLDAAEEFCQPVLGIAVERIAGGGCRLVQGGKGKIAGIEEIAGRIAIGLDEGRFGGPIGFVAGGRRTPSALSGLANLLADGAAGILGGQQIAGDLAQPGAVPRGVLHPHQPGQRQQHLGPFLLDAIGPDPAVGIGGHGHANAAFRLPQEQLETGLPVGPQIAGPQGGLIMRRIADRPSVEVMLPASLLQRSLVDAVRLKAKAAAEPQVGQQALQEPFVITVGLQGRRRQHHSQHRAGIVVAVIDGIAIHRARSAVMWRIVPADQAIGRMFWIGAFPARHPGAEIEPVAKIAGGLLPGRVWLDFPGQGHGAGDFAVAVVPEPPAHRLAAIGQNPGIKPLQCPQ